MFINFVKKQQEIVQEMVSDDGNFQPSSAACNAGNFRESSSAACMDDDEALIDVTEEETEGAAHWFNSLEVCLSPNTTLRPRSHDLCSSAALTVNTVV